jgi:hypothetical protein
MLNQLGAAIGIALVALLVQSAGSGDALGGFHAAYWGVTGALALVVVATPLLPGRHAPQETANELPAQAAASGGESGPGRRSGDEASATVTAQGDVK